MGFQEKLSIPQAATIAETKKVEDTTDPQPVLASIREPKESQPVGTRLENKADRKSEEKKKLVVPIKQQIPATSSIVNERPRIVAETQPVKYSSTTRSVDRTQ